MTASDSQDLISESIRIKNELLKIETVVARQASASRQSQMGTMRHKLGYSTPNQGETLQLIDTRITSKIPVITPEALATVVEVTKKSAEVTGQSRSAITKILAKKDDRLVVVVGPCSIHDAKGALQYAARVKQWRKRFNGSLEIVMRAYMEKPRTEKGWKGLVYDPLLDESEDINLGVVLMRLIACQITELGVPIAMERLNALTPQYVNSLVAYDTIGARNTLDQKSREYASGTSSPVGFKNTPEGSIISAVQAIVAARAPHAFLGMDTDGVISQINTTGNDTGHVILRGDQNGPNYSAVHIASLKKMLQNSGLTESIIIDASHGNSGKKADNQVDVITNIAAQVEGGEQAIAGVMIESNLVAGAQNLKKSDGTLKAFAELVYGQSITDECLNVDVTEDLLVILEKAVLQRKELLTQK